MLNLAHKQGGFVHEKQKITFYDTGSDMPCNFAIRTKQNFKGGGVIKI